MCITSKEFSKCHLIYILIYILSTIHISTGNQNITFLYAGLYRIKLTSTMGNEITLSTDGDTDAMDYHYKLRKLCWANTYRKNIVCGDFDALNRIGSDWITNREIILDGIRAKTLAVDWLTDNLYWSDELKRVIGVSTMNKPYYKKILYWTDIVNPSSMVLDPYKGLLFWADEYGRGKIERVSMNGNQNSRKIIAEEGLYTVKSLTIDYKDESIYWINIYKHYRLECMDYNGDNRKVIKSLSFPSAFTKFQNNFYYTRNFGDGVYQIDFNKEPDDKLLVKTNTICNLKIWDSSLQIYKKNPCDNNGGCSHFCLLSSTPPGYSCECPIGIKLITNTTCANNPKEMLIVALKGVKNGIGFIYLDSPDYSYKILDTSSSSLYGIDYDPIQNYIYFIDNGKKFTRNYTKIQKVNFNGTKINDVITQDILDPKYIAVDWIGKNLYWTEAGFHRIEVSSLDGKYRKIIINDGLFDTRAIVVSPKLGWMFWTDWTAKSAKIERSNLDGSDRIIILSNNIFAPNGIALDVEKMRLYFCDSRIHIIEYINMDGSNRNILLYDYLPHPFGLTLIGDYLYWNDWKNKTINRVHKVTGKSQQTIIDSSLANSLDSKMMDLKGIQFDNKPTDTNPCGVNNGNCSHFCFYRHNETYICDCPIKYNLSKDGKTCESIEQL